MIRTQVIVVGAGPVGTFVAYVLAIQGIDVIILEASDHCEADMRASTFHSPTISYLNQLGLADRLIQLGLKSPLFQYRIRSTNEVLEFDLDELSDVLEFPFRLQCEQYKFARMLANELVNEPNSEVMFENRVTSFQQDTSGVSVTAVTPEGEKIYHCDYLIAADGANSIIRQQLDVNFSGFTYPEKFLTLTTNDDLSGYFDDLCYVNYVSDPKEWYVLLKVPEVWRILVPMNAQIDDDYIVSNEMKDKIFAGLIGNSDDISTNHRTIYQVHQRVVDKMNHGRIVLAGDSAHLNNPLGGFGMNGGIHDAWNLGEKLTLILKNDKDSEKQLDHYDRQRRNVMNSFIQEQTIRNKKMIEEGDHDQQQIVWNEIRSIHCSEELRRNYMLRQTMTQSLIDEKEVL